MKKWTIRIICVLAFFVFFAYATHVVGQLIIMEQARTQLNKDLSKLSEMVADENVLSTDVIGDTSKYAKYVNNVLRMSESLKFKYDVEVNSRGEITNNKALLTRSYSGANSTDNPIKIYYLEGDKKKYIDSYLNCPQRDTVVYIELSMNVYIPSTMELFRTKDTFSQKYFRQLEVITASDSRIVMRSYKGK